MTLGEYLARERYSVFFRENYVVPMCAAIWSCSDRDTMAFPVITLIRFWVNHHLLNVVERPLWRVVKGRSKSVRGRRRRRFAEGPRDFEPPSSPPSDWPKGASSSRSRRGAPPVRRRRRRRRRSTTSSSRVTRIRRLILGGSGGTRWAAALAAIKYQPNEVYLHSDPSLMPRARRAWASWNCLKGISRHVRRRRLGVRVVLGEPPSKSAGGRPGSVQTLNPPRPPAADTIQHHVTLAHPLFNQAAIDAQKTIADAQGLGGGLVRRRVVRVRISRGRDQVGGGRRRAHVRGRPVAIEG